MNKRILLLFILITTFINVNGQQCQNLSIDIDDSSCVTPYSTLTANFLNTNYQTTSSYEVNGDTVCPPVQVNPSSANISPDDAWAPVIFNLGFTFCFYGNMYDQVIVSGNGVVSFDLSIVQNYFDTGSSLFHVWNTDASLDLPSPQLQPNAIFGPYTDPDPSASPNPTETIKFDILNQGEIGNRVFVIEYDVPMYSCNSEYLHSRIKLYETSNVIDIEILEKGRCDSWENSTGIVGIQNKSGTLATVVPGRQNADGGWWVNGDPAYGGNIAEQELWRFVPDGNPLNYNFQWYADLNHDGDYDDANECIYCDSPDPVPTQININPTEETDYKAELQYQGECSWTPISLIETITVEPAPAISQIHTPDEQYVCVENLGGTEAIFDLTEDSPLQNFPQIPAEDLYEVIYYIETDTNGDNVMDHVELITGDAVDLDGNPVFDENGDPIPLIEYYISEGEEEIQVLVQMDCDKDYDGDGMNNCDDPFPEIACDSTDPNEDCDGDGLNNDIDSDPLNYGPCNLDYDGDGMFDCSDPLPDTFCDVNNDLLDCDGDGILNGNDAEPLVASICNTTNCNGDCDNDGTSNCEDPDLLIPCDLTDCAEDCDGDGISNCMDIEPDHAINECNSGFTSFTLHTLDVEDPYFEYDTPFCVTDLDAIPQNFPVYNDPLSIGHIFTIDNGGIWQTPLTGTDVDGNDYTYSSDGIIDLALSGDGDDGTGTYNVTHIVQNTYTNIDVNGVDTIDVTCEQTYVATLQITKDSRFDYPPTVCKDSATPPVATNFVSDVDFTISAGGVFSDASIAQIDLDLTPAGIYTITYARDPACPISWDIIIYDTEFNYNGEQFFCIDGANPIANPVVPGGTYTINNGGVLEDTLTGQINIAESGLGDDESGIFIVTYSFTDGGCSTDFEITIEDTNFSFDTDVCSYDDNPIAFDYVAGGTFTVIPTINIDSTTGELDLSDPSIMEGTDYEITYTSASGTCSNTQHILINITPTATTPTTILTECNKGDGTAEFEVLSLENEIVGSQTNITLTFHLTEQEAIENTNAIITTPFARVAGDIWARVENNTNGCFNVIEIPLVVEDCYPILPQAFSPNSSITENQTFNVRNLKATYPDFIIYIYNRYGNLVYEGDISTENWNGKLNNDGDLLPAGTYFYGIKLNDEQELQYRGWVYLQQ